MSPFYAGITLSLEYTCRIQGESRYLENIRRAKNTGIFHDCRILEPDWFNLSICWPDETEITNSLQPGQCCPGYCRDNGTDLRRILMENLEP